MTATPIMAAALVVDTSVLVKWFKADDEELTTEALALRDRIDAARVKVYAPALMFYELGNILTRKTTVPPTEIGRVLAIIAAGVVVAPPDPALLEGAAALARAHDLTFYDASFLAVAVGLNCPFVTADRQLATRARRLRLVRHISTADDVP